MVHYSQPQGQRNMVTLGDVPKCPEVCQRLSWPGPRGTFLFGCLREFQRDQLNFLRDLWGTYGDYVRIPTVPGYTIYLLADQAAVEHVLVKNYKNYRKAEFITG